MLTTKKLWAVSNRLKDLKEDGYDRVVIHPSWNEEPVATMSIDDFLAEIERGEREDLEWHQDESGVNFRGMRIHEGQYRDGNEIRWKDRYYIRVYLPEDTIFFVNVYEVTSHFGGYEEGGWWYDWYECIQSVPVAPEHADKMVEEMEKRHKSKAWGNIHSIAGAIGGEDVDGSQEIPYVSGMEIVVLVEREPAESQTKERPHYE